MRPIKNPVSLRDIVAFLEPLAPDVHGATGGDIKGVGPLDQCNDDGWLTFCKRQGAAGESAISTTKAEVVICTRQDYSGKLGKTLIAVDNPRLAFMRVVSEFFVTHPAPAIHPSAVVEPSAEISDNVSIGANCYVGDAHLGAGTVLHEGVIVRDGTRIGKGVKIFPGAVIGGDGFGYERNEDGELEKFPHIGGVVIEDGVEIGGNACIDRGSIGDTRIRARARIDNLVHIAHNVDIGEDAAVIALSLVGGSVTIGKGAWIAPSAVIRNQVSIGENAMVGLGAVVTKNVPADATVLGNPAKDHVEFKKMMGAISLLMKQGK